MPQVWLRDVAKAAGVSVSAASHAINRTGNLAEETRKRILEVAESLKYARNPTLSAIAARRFQRPSGEVPIRCAPLQLIGPEEKRLTHWDRRSLQWLSEIAVDYGMAIDPPCILLSAEELHLKLKQLFHEGVEAILVVSSNRPEWLRAVDTAPFAVLGLEDLGADFPYDRVEHDWAQGVSVCYDALRRRGCRRIGAAIHFGKPWSYQDKVRIGAFVSEWTSDHGSRPAPLFTMSHDFKDADEKIVEWAEGKRLDGMVIWPLRYAYVLWHSVLCRTGRLQLAVFQTADLSEHLPVPGLQLSGRELAAAVAETLYSQVIHRRKGRPLPPRLLRIGGTRSNPAPGAG